MGPVAHIIVGFGSQDYARAVLPTFIRTAPEKPKERSTLAR